MKTQIDWGLERPWQRTAGETSEGCGDEKLQINVIFTTPQATLAALNAAALMANDLDARIRLVAPQLIPYAYPLERPPVKIEFMERKLSDLVRRSPHCDLVSNVHLYLCRDRSETMLEVLEPNSLIVIGGKKRWWPTEESRLARSLKSAGHQVIFAERR